MAASRPTVSEVPPAPGFLQGLRDVTTRHGALLIFDEVKTGFRFARGGAAEYFGVTPDLVTRFSAVDLVRKASEVLGSKGGGGVGRREQREVERVLRAFQRFRWRPGLPIKSVRKAILITFC